jgi:hypothetical protein
VRAFHYLVFALILALFVALNAPPAAAADLFVDNVYGNDLSNGSTPEPAPGGAGPLRSIEEALRRSHKHDRIVLANTGQPYRESLSLCTGRHSGDSLQPFVIVGNGAVLDGSAPVPTEAWQVVPGTDLFRFRPARMAYQQLFLEDWPLSRIRAATLDPAIPALQPLEWTLHRGEIIFRPEAGKWIDLYRLSHAVLPVGITLYKVRHVVIVDLIVQGYQLDGINAHDTSECRLVGVTCRGNGRSGVASVGAARLTIEESVMGDNGTAQFLSEGLSTTRIVNSQLIGNTAPEMVRRGGRVLVEPGELTTPEAP